MVNQDMQNYSRTTIDILNPNILKKYCFDKNITLKEFINEAIREKLDRETKQTKLS